MSEARLKSASRRSMSYGKPPGKVRPLASRIMRRLLGRDLRELEEAYLLQGMALQFYSVGRHASETDPQVSEQGP